MADRNTQKYQVVIAVLGLFAVLVILYVTTSPETFTSDNKDSVGQKALRQTRHKRDVRDDCLWELTASDTVNTLTSPNYPINYQSNQDCLWLITADDKQANISLKINLLSIEPDKDCRLDYLRIYAGSTSTAPSLGTFCGNIHDKLLKTNVSSVLLEFHSDRMYEDRGFSIDYFTTTVAGCHESLTDGSGSLRSPGFPENYLDDTDCSTLISVPEDKKVLLIFDSVDLEYGENCSFDYIQIFDGTTKNGTLLGQICQQTDARSFESSESSLLVHFHSDNSVNKKGYRARYSSVDRRSFAQGECQWETDDGGGTISSPNYPENYPSSSNCTIRILAPEGSKVSITVEASLLEIDYNCSYDFLLITEGPSSDSKTLGRFCGKPSEPKQLNSTQEEVSILFQSGNFAEFSGFKLKYQYLREETAKIDIVPSIADGRLEFSVIPENVTIAEGSSATLHCDSNHPTAKIRWLKGQMFLSGDTPLPGLRLYSNHSLGIRSMSRRLAGAYTCVAVSPEGELAAKAYVLMEETPTDFSCQVEFQKTPSDSVFEEGDFAHLECLAAGEGSTLSWEKDGAPLEMQGHVTVIANGYIFMERIQLSDAGLYTCVAREGSCVRRTSAVITVTQRLRIEEICGRSRVGQPAPKMSLSEHAKIVGGYDAPKGAYPWQVMLWEPKLRSFCGATLLNERWVATAAHCFRNKHHIAWDKVRVILGKHDRERRDEQEFETKIAGPSAIVEHPDFGQYTYDNDLALVRLRDRVTFTDHILPVCLGDRNTSEYLLKRNGTKMGTVIGWGKLKENGPSPRYLQEIKVPVVEEEVCRVSTNFTVTRNMFCAGYSQEVIGDACYGDSGGPFLMSHKERWYMVGIVSWGEGCGKQNKYGFYTRVANHLSWIQSVIKS